MYHSTGEKPLVVLLREAREVIEWAKSIGVVLPKNNNWAERALNKLEPIAAQLDLKEQKKEFERHYSDPVEAQNNIADLTHLLFIRQNVGNQDIGILRKKLSLVMVGPDSVRQETAKNTKSRDARFELSICAQLNHTRFHAVLHEPNPDVMATRKKIRAAIECKRIFSEKRLEKQINEGIHQLRTREGNKESDQRIVFCDMTRAITSGMGHLHGDRQAVVDDLVKELNKWAEKIMGMFMHRHVTGIDAVVLVYQDYIESNSSEHRLTAVTQQVAVINPNSPRRLRRKAERFALKFNLQSQKYIKEFRK